MLDEGAAEIESAEEVVVGGNATDDVVNTDEEMADCVDEATLLADDVAGSADEDAALDNAAEDVADAVA